MAIKMRCNCGRALLAPENFAGATGYCPSCGQMVVVPPETAVDDEAAFRDVEALPIREFLDPPRETLFESNAANPTPASTPVLRRMFEALLDPRAIQWMLMIGGGLCVLGIIVWLVSKGVFENKLVLAAVLGAGTLAILGGGWYTALRTRFRVAGQALTFLGCVVAPLNLWFYHAQGLATVDNHLWIGGVVCCLLYAFTVRALRDPLFMYACEAGVTLTALLLLADLGKIVDAPWLSLFLTALGLISIHAERAFSPAENAEFPRRRYGLPLFWSGHAQMGIGLAILLGSQLLGWLREPAAALWGIQFDGNLLTERHMVAAAVWWAAAYAYLYSDFVVRRIGVYVALAAAALVMAEATLLLGFDVPTEVILAAMALTSVGINVAQNRWGGTYPRLERWVPPLGWVLGTVPVVWGTVLHMRATWPQLQNADWQRSTDGWFVGVMLITAVCNRVSAWLVRERDPKSSGAYIVLSGLSLVVAAAGWLRVLGLTAWGDQAPWLMVIPIGYLIASRLWRGHSAERPLYWVAQGSAAAIMLHVLASAFADLHSIAPQAGLAGTLKLALVFVEATAFYGLATALHRRSVNLHLAAVAACGAIWQIMGYLGVNPAYYTMLYAGLGVVLLAASRLMGLEKTTVYRQGAAQGVAVRGAGLAAYQMGNAIVCVALLAAFMQGLAGLASRTVDWTPLLALLATVGAGAAATVVVPTASWRRFYAVGTVALAAVTFLRLNLMLDLSGWQKLEIFCVAVGLAMLAGSHVAMFRESDGRRDETVSMGLGIGSLLASAPLLIAVLYHRWALGAPSLYDELALLSITIAMTVTGAAWQIKASTLLGGGALVIYLAVLVCSLAYHPQVAIGVYLAAGGAIVFAIGVALSVYREKLLQLPERAARREGVFRILNWR
ncbi:MAG: hypothetical protein KDA44_15590 [Planctomycetales bacterium]|nr:hypothetical protein [Planctomycetales bacterium]